MQSFRVCGSLDAMRCDACYWFTVGLIEEELVEEELVEEGREEMAEHRVLENFYYVFFFLFYVFFFNIVLTWKFVEVSKVSVLYVYIDNNNILLVLF